jgi:hypothetical protein
MGTCVFLFVMAWSLVRLWSVPAAIGMCLVAMVIPPVAAIVANRKGPEDTWWDDPELPKEQDWQPERKPEPGPDPKPERKPKPAPSSVIGSSGDPESDAWWAELDDPNRKDHHE